MSVSIEKIKIESYNLEISFESSGKRAVSLKRNLLDSSFWELDIFGNVFTLDSLIEIITTIFANENIEISKIILKNYKGLGNNTCIKIVRSRSNKKEDYYETLLSYFTTAKERETK